MTIYYIAHFPVVTNMLICSQKIIMHQFSLINANTDFVVLSAAHLYRALQAHGFLEVPRDDLNFILTQQEKKQPLLTEYQSTSMLSPFTSARADIA